MSGLVSETVRHEKNRNLNLMIGARGLLIFVSFNAEVRFKIFGFVYFWILYY